MLLDCEVENLAWTPFMPGTKRRSKPVKRVHFNITYELMLSYKGFSVILLFVLFFNDLPLIDEDGVAKYTSITPHLDVEDLRWKDSFCCSGDSPTVNPSFAQVWSCIWIWIFIQLFFSRFALVSSSRYRLALRQSKAIARGVRIFSKHIGNISGRIFSKSVEPTNHSGNNILDMEITYLIGNEHIRIPNRKNISTNKLGQWRRNAKHSTRSYGQ